MPKRSEYAAGTPSWIDLGSPDTEASAAFYTALFGWTANVEENPDAGGYVMFLQDDQPVAGMGPLQMEGQPPAWSTYVTVDDADKTAAIAKEAGATVLLEPMDVLDVGRMAIFMDPFGAVISVWQPRAHQGAGLVNEPNTLCWNELATRDVDGSKDFYNKLFGWNANTADFGGMTYTELKVGDDTIAGMLEMGDNFPPEVPPHWLTYFSVADTDAIAAKAAELGGTIVAPPNDIPPGRMSVIADPHGATFAVLAMSQPGQ